MLPSFVSGRVEGLEPDTVLAVAVNGRVRGDDAGLPRRGTVGLRRTRAAIVTARRGELGVGFEVLADGELRPLRLKRPLGAQLGLVGALAGLVLGKRLG